MIFICVGFYQECIVYRSTMLFGVFLRLSVMVTRFQSILTIRRCSKVDLCWITIRICRSEPVEGDHIPYTSVYPNRPKRLIQKHIESHLFEGNNVSFDETMV